MRINRIRFPEELLRSVWFWVFALIIIFAGSYYPFRPDYFNYYEPTIIWLNKYGLITGVANIDWNLGQMSVFHIMQAGLDQILDPFQRLGIFITILFLVYLFERKAYLLLFVIPLGFLFIQAPSPDEAIFYFSLVIVNELCFNYKTGNFKVLFLVSVFTFIIKPVAFWLPLWTFFAYFSLNIKELKDYRSYLFPSLLVIIFLVKNVIASSTLFYPITFTKIHTYWLTDSRILDLSNQKAALYTFANFFTIGEINSMTFFQKFYYWISISELQTIINFIILISIITSGVFIFWKKNFLYRSLWIIIVIKSLIVFNFSGQFRFILDGIFPLLLILLYPFLTAKIKIFITALAFSLFFLLLISYPPLLKWSIPEFKLTRWMANGFTKESLFIPRRYQIGSYAEENIGNLDFYISSHSYNYDTPPPAFSSKILKQCYDLGIFPQMKDTATVRKGYYMKMLTPEEREDLDRIIKKYFHSSR